MNEKLKKNLNAQRFLAIGLFCLVGYGFSSAHADDGPTIAGLAPYQRPANAPRLTTDLPIDRQQALYGVSTPVPQSIEKFLQHQGGWFNPFLRPGMTGPYDLRGWHAQAKRETHK